LCGGIVSIHLVFDIGLSLIKAHYRACAEKAVPERSGAGHGKTGEKLGISTEYPSVVPL